MDHVTNRCTIVEDGDFCDAPSMIDPPFPICGRHALELHQHMRRAVEEALADPLRVAAAVHQLTIADDYEAWRQADKALRKPPAQPVVYYLRVGDLIKIGTSRNLASRLAVYPPNATVLATEPGSTDLERWRHEQFNHLLAGRNEWFRADDELLAHIERRCVT